MTFPLHVEFYLYCSAVSLSLSLSRTHTLPPESFDHFLVQGIIEIRREYTRRRVSVTKDFIRARCTLRVTIDTRLARETSFHFPFRLRLALSRGDNFIRIEIKIKNGLPFCNFFFFSLCPFFLSIFLYYSLTRSFRSFCLFQIWPRK